MKKRTSTDTTIEDLVAANCSETTSLREKHVYREALRGLVRLAKAEHMFDMKTSVDRLTGGIGARAARRQAKAILLAQRLGRPTAAGQKQLEFNQR